MAPAASPDRLDLLLEEVGLKSPRTVTWMLTQFNVNVLRDPAPEDYPYKPPPAKARWDTSVSVSEVMRQAKLNPDMPWEDIAEKLHGSEIQQVSTGHFVLLRTGEVFGTLERAYKAFHDHYFVTIEPDANERLYKYEGQSFAKPLINRLNEGRPQPNPNPVVGTSVTYQGKTFDFHSGDCNCKDCKPSYWASRVEYTEDEKSQAREALLLREHRWWESFKQTVTPLLCDELPKTYDEKDMPGFYYDTRERFMRQFRHLYLGNRTPYSQVRLLSTLQLVQGLRLAIHILENKPVYHILVDINYRENL